MIITASANKGIKCQVSDFSLVVDSDQGGKQSSKADIVLKTSTEAPMPEGAGEAGGEIIGAGEYEIGGTKVIGIQLPKESTPKEIRTAYSVSMDEIKLCFLGNYIHNDLNEDALDSFGEVDILFLPNPTKDYDGKKIAGLVKQIEPRVMIAVNGKDADQLVKDLGQKPEKMEKFVTKKKELIEMNSKLILLES